MTQEPTASQPDPRPAAPEEPAATPAAPEAPEAPAEPVPAPAPAPAEPVRRSRRGLKIVVGVVAGIVVLAVAGVVVIVTQFGSEVPAVGECLNHSDDPTEMEVVACDSDQAAWQVIGHEEGTLTEQEFDQISRDEVCQAFPDWENALWLRTNVLTGEGQVVCLDTTGAGPPLE